ncbi:hypothetical protein DQQ10_12240 [Pseudochryseolinea flava]|uniref:Uncharacterized protein n=2 Tax=Pseudochryseolinea flava TaxID=2059302 RepID=A0A364Y2L1_9BACT|nr:hypothetical protein DQQ10_12240 [Pseudochryseolinea flava]
MRYIIQGLPALDAQPYLHLPIKRSSIINFVILKSLFHATNISAILLFAPFAMGAISRTYGSFQGWMWLLALCMISLTNHFLVIIVKKHFAANELKATIFILCCSLIGIADYYGWIQLSMASEKIFNLSLKGYAFVVSTITACALATYFTYRIFVNSLYTDDFIGEKDQSFHFTNLPFLKNFGSIGHWISLELKLIFRHKRSRELLIMHFIFLLLPLAFYSFHSKPDNYAGMLFFGIVCSGLFMMNYGQFLFSWQSDHFDFLLSQPVSFKAFVASKYWLLTATTVLWFILSIPFAFLDWRYLVLNLACSVYNIGINTFIVMNLSMWGVKRLNLNHSGSLNIQGIGAAQWIMGIPLMISPYLFYAPFNFMGSPLLGLTAVGVAGLIGILFHKKLLALTTERFYNKRHLMASNFRKE